MKIVVTGGHLSPAISVVDELAQDHKVIFIGRKYALDNEKNISLEYKEIEKRKISFYHLSASRFTRILSTQSFINIFKFPVGLFQCYKILQKEKPDIILSFGGYIGFPVCVIGKILRIPIFIHEQTIRPGLVNRITGFLAKQVFISFEETKKYFQKSKITISGNPIRKNVLKVTQKPFQLTKDTPVIYITGGSLGSHSINMLIEKILKNLLESSIIIHQAGNVEEFNDIEYLKSMSESFTQELKKRYIVRSHFMDVELGYIYSQADIVIGRSGANTIFELIAWKKPSILVPLPWAANDEQLEHAKFMSNSGVSEIFNQFEPPEKLLRLITKVVSKKNHYSKNFKNLDYLLKKDAASIIAKTITQVNK